MTPDFSILHTTARIDSWGKAWKAWCEMSMDGRSGVMDRGRIEYVLSVDAQDESRLIAPIKLDAKVYAPPKIVINRDRPCNVDGWNCAAKASTGKILVVVSDDWFPPDGWDSILRTHTPDPSKEVAIWPAGQGSDRIMVCPILTRAYYERPGRGGHPNGELFYPGYLCIGSDDDFTEVAMRDGVVVRIPECFEHRHPCFGTVPMDDVYRWNNREEAYRRMDEVIVRRRRENYSS